jgi:cytochrome b6-f complex iron-sulfur subunit
MRKLPVTCGRREVIRAAAATAAVVAVGSVVACGPPFGVVSAGNASALAVGDVKVVTGASACIARDAQGVYAMTLICTHQGCDMSMQGLVSASGIDCGCHGSRFDVDGNVVNGPASSPLQHYQVTADAQGNLTIDGNVPVPATVRLAI